MDDLAQYIENWADLPVVNRTAVSGLFAVETEGWTPMRLPPPPPGNPPAARFDDLPTIFTVLRKLGLELKQQEATVPVYTVEHIERPMAVKARSLSIREWASLRSCVRSTSKSNQALVTCSRCSAIFFGRTGPCSTCVRFDRTSMGLERLIRIWPRSCSAMTSW
jgi:Protein of unknown function (DUF3738)